jgi:hypothetical protein
MKQKQKKLQKLWDLNLQRNLKLKSLLCILLQLMHVMKKKRRMQFMILILIPFLITTIQFLICHPQLIEWIFSRGLLINLPNVLKLGKGPEHVHVNCSTFLLKIWLGGV